MCVPFCFLCSFEPSRLMGAFSDIVERREGTRRHADRRPDQGGRGDGVEDHAALVSAALFQAAASCR